MTRKEMDALKPGDVVRHMESGESVMVNGTKANPRISVRAVHIADPQSWELERRARIARPR